MCGGLDGHPHIGGDGRKLARLHLLIACGLPAESQLECRPLRRVHLHDHGGQIAATRGDPLKGLVSKAVMPGPQALFDAAQEGSQIVGQRVELQPYLVVAELPVLQPTSTSNNSIVHSMAYR